MTGTCRGVLSLAALIATLLILSGPGRALEAEQEPWRFSRGGITVIGNADPGESANLLEAAANARAALEALAPRTATVVFPLTVFTDCRSQSTRPGIYEQKWGLYAVLRCSGHLDGRDAIEHHSRLLLQQAIRGLPLWLEVGSARLAASAQRSRDGGLFIGQPGAADVASYRFKPLPVRDVFAATRATAPWTDASMQGRLVRQAWLYTRHLAASGALDRCLAWPAESLDPDVELRRCLGTDIDVFHAVAVERWAEGAQAITLTRSGSTGPATSRRIDDEVFEAARLDAMLAANAPKSVEKHARGWLAAEPRGPEATAIAGRLKVASGDATGAASDFERSLATTFDPLVAYHYASALLGPALRADSIAAVTTSDAAKAEALLRRVVEVLPLADAMALLGIARLRSDDAGGAVQSLSDAVNAWPRHDYALWMARALASSRRIAAARRTAAPLQEIGETEHIRRRARDFIRQLPLGDGEAGPMPVLPPLRSGEQRSHGRLLDIDCRADWTALMLEHDDGTRAQFAIARLSLATFTFFDTPPAPVRCGRRETPEHVVVTWRADERTPAGSRGIIVLVAFTRPNDQP